MRYARLIYFRPGSMQELPEDEQREISAAYYALHDDPRVTDGSRLAPIESATTVRGEGLVTDGPFAETKEVLGGFYLVEADDLDGALDVARRLPAHRHGGSVEVRPLVPAP
jgi:hypothetical protein